MQGRPELASFSSDTRLEISKLERPNGLYRWTLKTPSGSGNWAWGIGSEKWSPSSDCQLKKNYPLLAVARAFFRARSLPSPSTKVGQHPSLSLKSDADWASLGLGQTDLNRGRVMQAGCPGSQDGGAPLGVSNRTGTNAVVFTYGGLVL